MAPPLTEGREGSREVTRILTALVYIYFFVRLLFYALSISPAIPPDEVDHLGISRLFSQSWSLPQDSPASYEYGPVTHVPYLYYYLMGVFLRLNLFGIDDLILLRILNALMSMTLLFYAHRWIRLLSPSRTMHLLFLVLLTNTPMLTFIGAAVNYDNLVNLTAVMSLYYLQRYSGEGDARSLLLFGTAVTAGSLTKITFLPLAFVMVLVAARRIYLRGTEATVNLRALVAGKNPLDVALLVAFGFLLILNLLLYGGNVVKYGKPMPQTKEIIGEENAMKYRFGAEMIILSQYREGKVSFEEAVAMAQRHINRPDDQARTLYYLRLARDQRLHQRPPMDRISYAELWLLVMVKNTFGILGHESMFKEPRELGVYHLIFLLALFFIVRYWRPADGQGSLTEAILIVVFYGLVIMQYANYGEYLRHLSPDSGIQGRYIFPVLAPLYGLMAYYVLKPWGEMGRIIISIFIGAYFIYGDFPFFLSQVTERWFYR